MSDEVSLEVYRALRESQIRYPYLLLAAAGAGIGLAVNETQVSALVWSQAPLAVAVVSWGLSFYCGCQHLASASYSLRSNFQLLRIAAGKHPAGRDPQLREIAAEAIGPAVESHGNRADRFGHWQFRLLICGAIFYLIWHVFEMYLRRIGHV